MKWNNEEIIKLKENYKNKTNYELSILVGRSKNSVACKLNELDLKKPKEHKSKNRSKINKAMGRDLSEHNVKIISLLYNSKNELKLNDNAAYNAAREGGYLNECCKHMTKFTYSTPQLILKKIVELTISNNIRYNDRSEIYPYELDIYVKEYKIGFEYDGIYWHIDKPNHEIKNKLCFDKGINLIRIVENNNTNNNYEKDIKQQFIENLNIINKISNKNLKSSDILNLDISSYINDIITPEKIRITCDSYSNYRKFQIEQKSLYFKLLKYKKLDEFTSHMKKKDQYNIKDYNIEEKLLDVVSKFSTLAELIKNSARTYAFIKRHKLDHLLINLKRKIIKK